MFNNIEHNDLLLVHTNFLLRFQSDFNKEMCDRIFNDLSDHLFSKWLKTDGNILNFFSQLDLKNKKTMLTWLLKSY